MSNRLKITLGSIAITGLAAGIVTLDMRRHELLTELDGFQNRKESLAREHADHESARLNNPSAAEATAKQVAEDLVRASPHIS